MQAEALLFPQLSARNERAGAMLAHRPALTRLPVVEARMAPAKICSVDGCGKAARGRGLCKAHHLRAWRHGDPTAGGTAKGAARDFLEICPTHEGTDCLIWPFAKHESGCAVLNRRGKVIRVPREVCRRAHGEPPAAHYQAAHRCGNGHLGCVNPKHLYWATPTENNCDKTAHGTQMIGARNPSSVLTENQVREIRRDFDPRMTTMAALGRRFGVTRETIRDIISRRTWAWFA